MRTVRVVVVGGGVGGLAAAARVALAGHDVTVFERSSQVGGKLGRLARDGFVFDTGPGLLTLPQVYTDLLGPLDLVPLDPIVRHAFPDGTVLDSCRDPAAFGERIAAALGAGAAREWAGLWRRAERVWRAAWRDILRADVGSPLALAPLAWRLRDLWAVRPGQTLRGLGVADPRLRMLVDRYATYAGADPRRAPAALLAVPYAEMAFGGWYLRGGLAGLADALLTRCLDLGVVVQTGARVTAIEAAGGRVRGVRVAGDLVAADAVVSNVDALTTYRELLHTPSRLARLADRSLAGFVLLLGVRGDSGMAHHTVYFPRDYDAEFDAVFGGPGRRARPVPDPAVYVTVADDPAVRPPGHEAWFVLVNAARHGTAASAVNWRRPGLAEAYADRILDVLAERGADVRDRLVFREIRTPADLADGAHAPGGAIYGTAGSLTRTPNRGPVRGLYLVGGSTHPGGGLPMVLLSAEIVARMVVSEARA
ncbi:phytoene desaturase family protein [Micromonospora sp. CPCC 206061]|uniref:phytoene desaturase family protein n=1 Tax=Micromonospora sp. CPCC 206061 TaxID=3122410 RepID=UPI003FA5DD35